ncbi:carbohydrate ABC transporter permease [Paenibacillus cymbidii]|uniref:carbohydrate ABC transporter permease n=1 Tax=Paenibacillus cymbidii TaxID=1639034 RepID=UPI0010802DA5|nr:carbohydrate ABC transporter permease [Paenibacillus cymbidii]
MSSTWSRKVFIGCNYLLLAALAVLCLVPLLHVLAISLSASSASAAGLVKLWPVRFTWKSYEFVLSKQEFFTSIGVSVKRLLVGTSVNMLLTILIAYPLSKEPHRFRYRAYYAWFFVLTILFHGGLVPLYMTVNLTGLLDTIWALVLPGAVPVFNMLLLLHFFRNLPKELEESVFIDGAGYWRALWTIYIPLSSPALATLTLFCMVHHWNSWFDGLIFMNAPQHYPLQSYLQTMIIRLNFSSISEKELELLQLVSDRSFKAAQIFLGALPILLVYPFLQKYFVKGMVLGSVKQ